MHGHLSHDFASEGSQRWYIYMIQDIPCDKAIIGSTVNPYKRWSNHKSSCNNGPCKGTGLSKHFTLNSGCPFDPGKKKETLNFTLVDYIDFMDDDLRKAGHEGGPKCRCWACSKLKDLEDQWILKLGTFYGDWGMNERDEIQSKTRYNWKN